MDIASGAMKMTAELALPILLTSLVIGLVVSLFQSVTQIQEVTLTFVPKLVATALVLLIGGHWMLSSFIAYVDQLFGQINTLLAGGMIAREKPIKKVAPVRIQPERKEKQKILDALGGLPKLGEPTKA